MFGDTSNLCNSNNATFVKKNPEGGKTVFLQL